MTKREPRPSGRADFDAAAELLDVPPHDVHADAAARDVGRLVVGRKAGHEDEMEDLLVAQHFVRPDESALARLRQDAVALQAAAVVAHFHDDAAALVIRLERDDAGRRLARRDARLRHLDAVIHAVAHQVHERIADLLQHRLVELGLVADHLQLDLLAEPLAEIAHHAREAAEHETDRQHAHAHDAFLQLAHVALELRQSGAQLVGQSAGHLRAELREHRLRDDQLADGVHQLVDLLGADADRAAVAKAMLRRFGSLDRCSTRRLARLHLGDGGRLGAGAAAAFSS